MAARPKRHAVVTGQRRRSSLLYFACTVAVLRKPPRVENVQENGQGKAPADGMVTILVTGRQGSGTEESDQDQHIQSEETAGLWVHPWQWMITGGCPRDTWKAHGY